MLVSIVIPIYNGEKYIKKMYRSLSRQSFQDFELLYINDGSSDNSLDILVQIAKEDKRVKVYSHKNQGICASRNLGISNSHGKYIIFLESLGKYTILFLGRLLIKKSIKILVKNEYMTE